MKLAWGIVATAAHTNLPSCTFSSYNFKHPSSDIVDVTRTAKSYGPGAPTLPSQVGDDAARDTDIEEFPDTQSV